MSTFVDVETVPESECTCANSEKFVAQDVLSDGGEDFCECQEQYARPHSGELCSDEEFQDAETEHRPRSKNISGVNDQAFPSPPETCQTGKDDNHELPRHRSSSRIPVPTPGRFLNSFGRGSFENITSSQGNEGEGLTGVCESPAVTVKVSGNDDKPVASEEPVFEFHGDSGVECNETEYSLEESNKSLIKDVAAAPAVSPQLKEEDLQIMNNLCTPSETILGLGNTQTEVVVMTLAEERHQNVQNLIPSFQAIDLKNRNVLSTDNTLQHGRRVLSRDEKAKPRSDIRRLDAIIRDRSGDSLMKQEETTESKVKTQRASGRQSATSPSGRLQAIREEKAQIRQRISSATPISPAKSRRFIITPNIKQALNSPLATSSLKRDIASRRPIIERLAKETPKKCPVPYQKLERNSKERTRLMDSLGRIPRSAAESSNKVGMKSSLSTISSRYGVRSKPGEEQKSEIPKYTAQKQPSPVPPQRSSTAGLPQDDCENEKTIVPPRPMSSHLPGTSVDGMEVSVSSTSVVGTNTDPLDDKSEKLLVQLEEKREELLKTKHQFKKEVSLLKKINEDQDEREVDMIKERNVLQNILKEQEKRMKELEVKLADRDNTIAQLRGNLAKIQDLADKLKTKENQLLSLRRQFTEESKEHSLQLKRTADAKEALQQELEKERGQYQKKINKMQEDNDSLRIRLDDITKKAAQCEHKEVELEAKLQKEIHKNHSLEDSLMCRESELFALERKLEEMENSSSNILGLSEQLMQKDTIISELEKHRSTVQSQNSEMCRVVSGIFTLLGQQVDEKEIEALLTSGKTSLITDMLHHLIRERYDSINTIKEECQKEYQRRVSQLEKQVAGLQAELQETKNYSESLAGVISDRNSWQTHLQEKRKELIEGDCPIGDHTGPLIPEQDKQTSCLLRSPSPTRPLSNNGHQGYIRELFVLLEGKRQALLRMERKMQELEEIHANCAQKRVRNEIRIDQLEMMLASYKV